MTYHDMCDVGMMWNIIVDIKILIRELWDANFHFFYITNTYLAGKNV